MDNAKKIAADMLAAINIDNSGFLSAVAKGFISFPVSLGYLGYDFIDTDRRRENLDDKYRLACLVKTATFNKDLIEKVIKPFIDDFVSRIDMDKIVLFTKNVTGTFAGKVIFAQVTGVNIGRAIVSQGIASYVSGFGVGGVLAIGAEASRSIYTARYLRERNPKMYDRLYRMGDLDLLYYLVEDVVRPYEKACAIAESNSEEFNRIFNYFIGGL
ncbi:hypothetical protein VRB37_20355 [Erwinia billingiae]|uniref:hypothetical protein n=1 Tax=Erwinia billingiae TaxID=182337 RepID=UPI0030D4100E